jgi:regulatory protein
VEVSLPRKTAASPPPSAYARALAKLARRDHAEGELRRALGRAGHPPGEVEAAVSRLKDRGIVDDARFAEAFSRSRLRHRGLGSNRIRAELRHRGLPSATAEQGLRAARAEVSEGQALDELARRYWKLKETEEPRRRVRKLWAHLLRRGYPADLVGARLRALWPRWSDALDGLEPAEEEP